jgi:glycyl-tRNA synthetase
MLNLYNRNGLLFWTGPHIRLRNRFVEHITDCLRSVLRSENSAFKFQQIEAPILTPMEWMNPNYTKEDIFVVDETPGATPLVLRPETTMGSYAAARHILDPYQVPKSRMPLVVWQHGKSFRREQDQVTKNMRLKEFYQLEFQILYALNTANDYAETVVPAMKLALSELIGPCRTETSDRLPDYSEQTVDVICEASNMEVCSISKRKDFPDAKCLEVAVGTDRLLFNALERRDLEND